MGLDQYLSAKRYVTRKQGYALEAPSNPAFDAITERANLTDYCEHPSVDIYGTYVSVNAAYWRKANQIHQWFVDNVQDGNDNCGEYYVSTDQLEELRSKCNEILAHKEDKALAEDLLPPQDGFFFGGTELDEWYYQDIEYTAERLKQILEIAKRENDSGNYISFAYQSSW